MQMAAIFKQKRVSPADCAHSATVLARLSYSYHNFAFSWWQKFDCILLTWFNWHYLSRKLLHISHTIFQSPCNSSHLAQFMAVSRLSLMASIGTKKLPSICKQGRWLPNKMADRWMVLGLADKGLFQLADGAYDLVETDSLHFLNLFWTSEERKRKTGCSRWSRMGCKWIRVFLPLHGWASGVIKVYT